MASAVWSYLVENVTSRADDKEYPIPAMRHEPSGYVFYLPGPITAHLFPIGSYYPNAKRGRGWNLWKKEEQARAEYERLLAAGEISMRCEFCRIEGHAFTRSLCPACLLLCWTCGEAATVSEIPSDNYRAGEHWAYPPATFCAGCFAESERKLEAYRQSVTSGYGAEGITDADIPF